MTLSLGDTRLKTVAAVCAASVSLSVNETDDTSQEVGCSGSSMLV